MDQHLFNINQQQACEAIEGLAFDFTATYFAAFELNHIARRHTGAIHPRSITALKNLLLSTAYDGQRQRRFLFREAAAVLATIVQLGRHRSIARKAYDALQAVLLRGRGHALQAAADALGSLPVNISGPEWPGPDHSPAHCMGWKRLFKANGIISVGEVRIKGRSFAFPLADGRIAVIKMAKTADDASALRREIRWMSYLSDVRPPGRRRFDVPEAITADGAVLFKLEGLPKEWTSPLNLDAHPVAVGYIASGDYFRYPNPAPSESLPTAEAVLEMMGRNAYLFAWLAGRGIVHEAPIPLFHNRLQQERRRDGGTYEWFRAGRLDRWLASCAYPNFGRSGLRDFEHFVSFDGKQVDLYRSMGNHLLSLLMVAGSYFRAKDPDQTGWDPAGRPVDARYLFDRPLLHKMVNSIYGQYYNGFVGAPPKGKTPLDVDRLVDRMIDEMGVDRHMLEYLRVADQNRMSRSAFEAFLVERGYRADAVAGIEKGARDLDLSTGPHLGAFNRGISIPELIDATAAMAAACMAERFLKSDPVPETTAGR